MNDPQVRKRLMWLAAIGGTLLACLLFVSIFAPDTGGNNELVVRPLDGTAAATVEAPAGPLTDTTSDGVSNGFSLGGGGLVSLAWRLALVAVIIAVSVVGLRWWGRKAAGPKSTTGFLRVVDTLAISNGRSIHLVAMGDRVIAIGATAQQLTMLNELTVDEAGQVLAQASATSDQPLSQFAAQLFESMRRGTNASGGRRSDTVTGGPPSV